MAYQKLIDAAVRAHFPVQLHLAARHVELDGVTREALQAQRSIIAGCAFATTLLQLLLVGPLREVVVGDLSLQRFGDHNQAAHKHELASTCMVSKLTPAGREIATKKSKGLGFRWGWRCSARRQSGTLESFLRQESEYAVGEIQRACETDQENPLQIVGSAAATASADCARVGVKGTMVLQSLG